MNKSGCCFSCGLLSFLGAFFYGTLAIMTSRRNLVFLEHKAGMNMFEWTDDEVS